MKEIVRVLQVFAVIALVIFIALVILVTRGCHSPEYFAVHNADLRLVKLIIKDFETDSLYDGRLDTTHFIKVTADSVWDDSACYGIMIFPQIIYCDDCSGLEAQAVPAPGLSGTKQKIKHIKCTVTDRFGKYSRDIENALTGNAIPNNFEEVKNSLNRSLPERSWGNAGSSTGINPLRSASTLAAYRDSFNLNSYSFIIPALLFEVPQSEIYQFPNDFKLRLELVFEDGFSIVSWARGSRK